MSVFGVSECKYHSPRAHCSAGQTPWWATGAVCIFEGLHGVSHIKINHYSLEWALKLLNTVFYTVCDDYSPDNQLCYNQSEYTYTF